MVAFAVQEAVQSIFWEHNDLCACFACIDDCLFVGIKILLHKHVHNVRHKLQRGEASKSVSAPYSQWQAPARVSHSMLGLETGAHIQTLLPYSTVAVEL